MGIVVEIGGMSFPSKKALKLKCREILRKDEQGTEITGDDAKIVDAILKGRPDKLAEIGSKKVVRYLRIKHPHNTPCFSAELDDGSIIHFSFMKFITAYPEATVA
ncbi:DUF3223 domain-containing protein [uncultured Roseibium sp.]|uniref:DUF3223 domain-containing protein n=1 Tax=uncultured Roseibium sp. TaxID=1936171 RepID=UPI00262D95BC|nr:DUF3223 domain-containing protein [uncultured Roseibium sp.]